MTEETAREAPAGHPRTDNETSGGRVQPREKWAHKLEFMFSMAAKMLEVGNIWRFPYLCFKNGGVIFFIPYFVSLIFFGAPLMFLETALGQYTGESGVTAWRKICPMFEGVGVAAQVVLIYLNIYNIMIPAYTIYYLYNSCKSPLPWSNCANAWNTDACHNPVSYFTNPHLFKADSDWSFLNNMTLSPDYSENFNYTGESDSWENFKSPADEFWMHSVLRISDSMSLTSFNWHLLPCLLIAWFLCYFSTWKGIKFSGKLVYVTVLFPYLMLFLLFIRGVTLPGASVGIKSYLMPDLRRLPYENVWVDAFSEVLYSYAVHLGVLTTLGSYNKYNNNCYRDCLALCCLTTAVCIFAGLVVFSFVGFVASQQGLPITEVVSSGVHLAFSMFPSALSGLPGAHFWTLLFFLVILFLSLNNQLMFVQSLATVIIDMLPHHLRRPYARELLVLVIAGICFVLALPMLTEGGFIIFSVIDNYGVSRATLAFIALVETIAIAWVYGADRFYDNIEDMIGYRPYPVLKYCWLFIIPLFCMLVLLYDMVQPYGIWVYGYIPGHWATVVGRLLIITSLLCIPIYILVSLYRNADKMTTPSDDLRQARPHKPILTLCKCTIFKSQPPPSRSVDTNNEKIMMEAREGV